MRIGVEGHGYRGVAQEFLHQLGVYAAAEQERGACVPEVVEAGPPGNPARFRSGLKRRLTHEDGEDWLVELL